MKLSSLALLIACLLCPYAGAQNFDFGGESEATRQLRRFQSIGSADRLSQNIKNRGAIVNNGFGVSRLAGVTQPPANISAPPRAQSASFGVGVSAPTAKPFSSVSSRPTVSPYLNLFRETLGDDDLNYQTLVRPQLQQQQFNQQVVRQEQAINNRITSMAARNPFATTGNQQLMPTGHAATFQNYSRFYPQATQQRR